MEGNYSGLFPALPRTFGRKPQARKEGGRGRDGGAAYATQINHADQSSQRLAKYEVSDRLGAASSSHLVNGGSHRALQQHLQHLCVRLLSVRGHGQLPGLLLHVLDGHFNGSQVKLRAGMAVLLKWKMCHVQLIW